MSQTTVVIDIDELASAYAGVLLYLRLLRAAVAYFLYVALFLGAVLSVVSVVGAVVSGNPLVLVFGIGALILLSLMLGIAVLLYAKAVRGSLATAWVVLCFSLLVIVVDLAAVVAYGFRLVHAPPARRGSELLNAASLLLPIYVLSGLAYGSFRAVRSQRLVARTVLADRGYGLGRRSDLHRLLGLPIAQADHRPALRSARTWAALALAVEGFAFATYFFASASEPPDLSLFAGTAIVLIGWPLGIALLYILLGWAQRLRRRARRAALPTLGEAMALDTRPPVLFLRSFADDQVSLASARVPRLLRVMEPGVVTERLEEIVVQNAAPLGPVVAIGRPGDVDAPIGASRAYLPDHAWQSEVASLLTRASAVVVALSGGAGLQWELQQVRTCLAKTLLLVPPDLTARPDEISSYAAVAGLELSPGELTVPATDKKILAFWQPTVGPPRVVVSTRLSEIDYELAFRLFLAYGELVWPARSTPGKARAE